MGGAAFVNRTLVRVPRKEKDTDETKGHPAKGLQEPLRVIVLGVLEAGTGKKELSRITGDVYT